MNKIELYKTDRDGFLDAWDKLQPLLTEQARIMVGLEIADIIERAQK